MAPGPRAAVRDRFPPLLGPPGCGHTATAAPPPGWPLGGSKAQGTTLQLRPLPGAEMPATATTLPGRGQVQGDPPQAGHMIGVPCPRLRATRVVQMLPWGWDWRGSASLGFEGLTEEGHLGEAEQAPRASPPPLKSSPPLLFPWL